MSKGNSAGALQERAPILFPEMLLQGLQSCDPQVRGQNQILCFRIHCITLPELEHQSHLHSQLPMQALKGLVRHLDILHILQPCSLSIERKYLSNRVALAVSPPDVSPERLFGMRDDPGDDRADGRRVVY